MESQKSRHLPSVKSSIKVLNNMRGFTFEVAIQIPNFHEAEIFGT